MWTRPVEQVVSQATRAPGSCAKMASRMASEIWSQILSGCPSVTDSDVKELWTLGKASYKIFGRNATVETKSAQPERLRAVTLIFRFPAGLGTLRIQRRLSGFIGPVPSAALDKLLFCCCELVYHRFLAKSTIFRCAVQTVCTKVGQMRQRVWFWRRAFPIGGRWPRPRPRPDEGKALLAAHRRVVASTRPSSVTFGDSFPLRGGKPFSLFSRAARRTAACKSGSRAPRPADL